MDNKSVDPSFKGAIVKVETKSQASDISIIIDAVDKRIIEAETMEECEKAIDLRRKVNELDKEIRLLNYSQQLSEAQLQQAQQKAISQNWQQVGAIVASIIVGTFLFPISQQAGLLFLVIGLAKPLGYSLVEIASLLDSLNSLKGFTKDSAKIMIDGSEQINKQDEESGNARP